MPDTPADDERRRQRELAEQMRKESAALAEALESERVKFDRQVRLSGGLVTALSFVLVAMAPFTTRGAAMTGVALVCGPLALVLGGQGATRAEHLPAWVRVAFAVGAFIGGALGAATLR
jgi:hypothetical protein